MIFEVTANIILATGPQNICTRESAMSKVGKMRFLRLFFKVTKCLPGKPAIMSREYRD